jgi:hypothetical protein
MWDNRGASVCIFNLGTVWNRAQVHVTAILPVRKLPPISIKEEAG